MKYFIYSFFSDATTDVHRIALGVSLDRCGLIDRKVTEVHVNQKKSQVVKISKYIWIKSSQNH